MKQIINKSGLKLRFQSEIADALASDGPIVALESNVITHGLRYPQNVDCAHNIEAAVRESGAIPATIFIEDGALVFGSDATLLERFATDGAIPKVSSRDLPMVLAKGGSGATTVASSLICADWAGIKVFSSAGIGGVHRGAAQSMDVSADLIQFTRSKVATVCAGAKMILDLGLTMEFLETHCVPLVAYKSDDFPAFFCTSSGFRCPHRIDDPAQMAAAIALHRESGGPGGILITTPPRKEDALCSERIETAIQDALEDAATQNISGAGLTKFLMRALDVASDGQTAKANAAVLISTARHAGEIAVALAKRNIPQKTNT